MNVEIALGRIKEARGFLGIATGERNPDLNGFGAAVRQRVGQDFESPRVDNPDTFTSLGLDSSWELDLWGRIRRSVESAEANMQASIEDYRDVLVVLFSDIARSYVDMRTLQARIQFAEKNIAAQRATLQVTKDRYASEISAELDVFQAELNLARTESILPTLNTALIQTCVGFSLIFSAFGCKEEVQQVEQIRPVKAVQLGAVETLAGRTFPGKARAFNEVNLGFEVAGTLAERLVNKGDEVKKGQLLARLDPRDFQTI